MMKEEWKEYITYNKVPSGKIITHSEIEVSNFGNVRGKKWVGKQFTEDLLCLNEKGRRCVGSIQIFRLVWTVFVGPIPKGYCIHHIDYNRLNDRLDNLMLMKIEDHNKLNKCTEEAKRKISKSKQGKSNVPRSEETKRKISNTLKIKGPRSEETKRKISNTLKNKYLEQRQKTE